VLFIGKLDLNLRKKLVKRYNWSTILCDGPTWTLRKVDQKHVDNFEMWSRSGWRRLVGSIVREMKRYYTESRRIGIAYII
jgi:hypothetical protein